MRRSHLWLISFGLLATVLLWACHSGGDNTSSTSNPPVDNTQPAPGDTLPPDPGEAGKISLEGVDSDDDGVRDDIQIAIARRYPNSEEAKESLEQTAKAIQQAIIAGNSSQTNAIIEASDAMTRSVYCLNERFDDSSSEISFLESAVVNTTARSEAYIQFNEALNGQFFGSTFDENACE